MQQSPLKMNDMPLHKYIPMEILDLIQPNQVRILYYQSPSRFYVYLRQKINTHAQFQVELQRAMQNYQSVSSPTQYQRYQPVVAQDNHAIWHRATILNINSDFTEIYVYFVDVGQQENISISNIRPLPQEFIRQPAFAIPCRLYQICPRNSNDQSTWKIDDPVHDEFNKLMANNASCKVCDIQDQICYDVAAEIPKVGDLGKYLLEKNLVSRTTMRSSQATAYTENQPQQPSLGRLPPGLPGISSSVQQQRLTSQNEYFSNTVQPATTRLLTSGLQKPIVQLAPSVPVPSTDTSASIRPLPLQDGCYIITHVYSALEFYGHSQVRERELEAFHKHLEVIYNNNNTNDQSLSVHFLMEGVPCVIQQGDKYHRVIIKHRESDVRVLVKLVDRGDELLVDTSELLQLEEKYFTIPAFAQPFRLHNYDELQSTATITRKLKRLILNQRVHISQQTPMINGFYPVKVKLLDNQLVNQIVLSNDNIPIISPTPPVKPVEPQTFNNPPKPQQDINVERTNDVLPAPQKLLTGPSGRTQPGRFGQNDQTARVPRQPQDESRPFGQQQTANGNRFNENQQPSTDQNRSYSRGFNTDEQQTNERNGYTNNRGGDFADRGNRNYNRNNEENNNENGGQRSGGFNNRGGGFADRGGRSGGSQDRNGANRNNQDEDSNENNGAQRSGGFNNRGGDFTDRGGRSGGFQDRNGANRNNQDEDSNENNGAPRSGGFNNRGGGFADRGGRSAGFQDRNGANRNNEENNNENGAQRSGGFNNRGGGSGFADRGNRSAGFQDRNGANRNNEENNNENGAQRSGGFNNRGGGSGFADRGSRFGGFQDRSGTNRNNQDEDGNENNGAQRSQGYGNRGGFSGDRGARTGGFNGERGARTGGFQNPRDRGEGGGDFERRGGFGNRGGQRGGRSDFGDRGGRGGRDGDRGGRSGDNGFRSNADSNDSMKTFSGWPNVKPAVIKFEAGDRFIENEIPKETFQFVVSHIETPNDFFIQLLSKADELSTLTDTLQKEYKEAPELYMSSIKINQACLAKSSDECWYRAIVLTTGITKIKVRFIDFGDTTDVDTRTIRQLAKQFCSSAPYAYRCTLKNVEANENINTNNIVEKCAGKNFDGKIEKKNSDDKYLLESDNFQNLMIDINAIKSKPQDLSIRIKSLIVYIDADKHQFYIQDDDETIQKVTDLIHQELTTADDLAWDEIKLNSMVISMFDDAPYRAIIQSDIDDNVNVYFVDYGNTNMCLKNSLKKPSEQLCEFPYQAKRCQLDGVSFNELDQAFKQLNDYLESEKVEISIVNQNEDSFHVLVYVDGECLNEKFRNESIVIEKNNTSIDMDDQSSTTTTATTVQEQERPASATGKRNNDEILSPVGSSLSASTNIKRKKSESETEVTPKKYHKGALTYVDKNKPIVYLQLLPESESNLDRINELIETVIQEDKHNSSYQIGDYIIAQYSEDNNYYRARIESYSSATQNYTVYFLDYGNLDENVPLDHLFSYSKELEELEAQAHQYSIENINSQTWIKTVRSLINAKLNDIIEFYFVDETKSIIHIKFDNENPIYNIDNNQPKTFTANISGTNKDCFYIHIVPDANLLICETDELLQTHAKEHQTNHSWVINDLCIVFDTDENQYFRGKILQINNEKYCVQCIDYGKIIEDVSDDNLYLLIDEQLLKQAALARQCRLHGVNEKNQIKAIEDIIQNIDPTERVTITVENDQNDQCMFVMLFRENNEIVNDRYQSDCDVQAESDTDKKSAMMLSNASDSAIAADGDDDDNDTSNGDVRMPTNDQQLASPIGIPQAESTHQYGDSTNLTLSNSSPSSSSITINQTIDFGENDPSTSNTTIKDDTENDNLSLN